MEKKWMIATSFMAALVLLTATEAHFPTPAHQQPMACIDHCLKDCKKLKGVITSTCLKYCPVHCLPPNALAKDHVCKLSCVLDTCAKYAEDEKKTKECVSECHKIHCKIQALEFSGTMN